MWLAAAAEAETTAETTTTAAAAASPAAANWGKAGKEKFETAILKTMGSHVKYEEFKGYCRLALGIFLEVFSCSTQNHHISRESQPNNGFNSRIPKLTPAPPMTPAAAGCCSFDM